jgi:hypothetical protein
MGPAASLTAASAALLRCDGLRCGFINSRGFAGPSQLPPMFHGPDGGARGAVGVWTRF